MELLPDVRGGYRQERGSQMTERTALVLSLLGKGKENAVRREDLAAALGVDDRAAREAVCYARLEGFCINNDQDGTGYYLPDSEEECHRQFKQTMARALKLFKQLTPIRHELERYADADQLSLFDTAFEALSKVVSEGD